MKNKYIEMFWKNVRNFDSLDDIISAINIVEKVLIRQSEKQHYLEFSDEEVEQIIEASSDIARFILDNFNYTDKVLNCVNKSLLFSLGDTFSDIVWKEKLNNDINQLSNGKKFFFENILNNIWNKKTDRWIRIRKLELLLGSKITSERYFNSLKTLIFQFMSEPFDILMFVSTENEISTGYYLVNINGEIQILSEKDVKNLKGHIFTHPSIAMENIHFESFLFDFV